jgi:hypothetical protein
MAALDLNTIRNIEREYEDKVLKMFDAVPKSLCWIALKYLCTVLRVRITAIDVDYEIVNNLRKEANENKS